jgi:hypothetical protein
MYFLETLVCNMLQCVCFIPSVWEDVERNLPANGVGETIVSKFVLQDFDECSSEAVLLGVNEPTRENLDNKSNLVVRLELVSLSNTASRN